MAGRPRKRRGRKWDSAEDAFALVDAIRDAKEDVERGVPWDVLVERYGWVERVLDKHFAENREALRADPEYQHLDEEEVVA